HNHSRSAAISFVAIILIRPPITQMPHRTEQAMTLCDDTYYNYQNKAVIYDLLFKASSEIMPPPIRGIWVPGSASRRCPHLGLGHDASAARAHDRARRVLE